MHSISFDDWTIRVASSDYAMWISPNNLRAIIDFKGQKIATVGKDKDGKIKVISENSIVAIDANNKLIVIGSQHDNSSLEILHWHQ